METQFCDDGENSFRNDGDSEDDADILQVQHLITSQASAPQSHLKKKARIQLKDSSDLHIYLSSVYTSHIYIYISLDQVLYRTQCENAIRETSLELTEKISQQKNSAKKDFHSAWSDVKEKESILLAGVKSREVDLAYAKFAFEKENYQEELHQKENCRMLDEKNMKWS